MAKYDVTMSCGHVQTVQLFGKESDRDKKIAWFEKYGLCDECYKAQKEAERAEATAKAAEKASTNNLPALTGSEKQINWALTIREKFLAEVDEHCDKCIAGLDDAQKIAENKMQCQAIKTVLANFTEARFWIDNRNSLVSQIIKQNNLKDAILAEIATLKASAGITEVQKVEETATVDAEAKIIEIAPAKFEVVVEGYLGKAILLMQSKASKRVEGDAAAISYALSELNDNVDTVYVYFYDDASSIVKLFLGTPKEVKNILQTLASAYPAEAVQAVVMSDVEDDGSNDDPDDESVLDTVGFNFDDDDDDDDELIDEPVIDNAAADENQSIVQFEANKTYRGFAPDGRSEQVTINRRTRCTVNVNGLKRRIYVDNGVEYIKYVNQIKVYADAVVNVQDVEKSKVEEVQGVAEVQAVEEPQTLEEYRTAYGEAWGTIMYLADGCEHIRTLAEYQVAYGNDLGTKLYNAANGIKMSTNAKFEVGKVYVALDDCQTVVFYTATERTAKTVTFKHLVDDSVTITQYEINFDDDGNEVVCGLLNSAIDYNEETPQVEVNTMSVAKLDAIHCQLFGADGADDTCSTLKGDDTASLQAELDSVQDEIEICRQDVGENERNIAYYHRRYLETIAKLAKIEDKITEYGLILHEDKKALTDAETRAAAIRAQIDSQKYSAQNLLDAVNSVDDTVAVDTITFELQQFAGDEGETYCAKIFEDTDLTPAETFTGLVDTKVDEVGLDESHEDREFDWLKSKLISDIHDYANEIEVLEKRITELSAIKLNTLIKLSKKVLELQNFISHNVRIKKNVKIEVISSIDNKSYVLDEKSRLYSVELKAEISTYNGMIEVYIDINGDEMVLANYKSVTDFKAAIRELAAAIKRGDAKYKFLPDESAK